MRAFTARSKLRSACDGRLNETWIAFANSLKRFFLNPSASRAGWMTAVTLAVHLEV